MTKQFIVAPVPLSDGTLVQIGSSVYWPRRHLVGTVTRVRCASQPAPQYIDVKCSDGLYHRLSAYRLTAGPTPVRETGVTG